MRMYSGPELPASQTALVRGADISINLVSCDGRKITSSDVIILPGDHTIEMSYYQREVGYSVDTALIDFTAEAGHVYVVDRLTGGGNTYRVTIIDRDSQHKVGRNERSSRTPEQSLELYSRYVKEAPRWPGTWMQRGDLLVTMKRYKDALSDYEKALSLTINAPLFKDRDGILKRISDTKRLILD
jgi:tetratricopeptide (TPR) repeat protein